ncbi:response regulator [Denitrobaculum tricleocarpae]|uniref:Response regulator n=1 Tax=Denitrobaculum tricleocarpae TaxID=2591009 RepID=A0A545SZ70_9PROT|nr:response regulator [Denitrobaculum tricleocarpae]TQV70266.1 response regulator [Denitrobaculum tricleocarpae]
MLGRSRSLQQNLVIQEETLDHGVLPMLLKSLGGDASCPDSPQHAVQLLQERQFDVVLTDLNFLNLSGIELIDAVRKGEGPNAQTPILVVTTDDCEETRKAALSAGADGYLIKPVLRTTLQQEIVNAVARREALSAIARR